MMNEEHSVFKEKKQKGFGLLATIIIIVVTAIVSGITTGVILYNTYGNKSHMSYEEFTNDKALQEFIEIYSSLTEEYYKDIDKTKMLEEAISAMTKYLGDNYTSYLTEEESALLSQTLSGKYKGIGVTFKDKMIIEVFENSPASKAGIQPNDILIKVNDKVITDLKDAEVASLIKAQDKEVSLVIKRNDKELNFKIELSTLNTPAISYEMKENNIGYIYLSTFSSTLVEQVKEALQDLQAQGMKALILDVRDNSGGYLVAASDLASLFIEKGKTIYSLQDSTRTEVYKDQTDEKTSYPITVLINKNSASASEILAGALKESYGSLLVGNVSFGKGKVQQTKTLSDGSMIKYTSAKWLMPDGECIDGVGITPDYELDNEYIYNDDEVIVDIKDHQLTKAIEITSK